MNKTKTYLKKTAVALFALPILVACGATERTPEPTLAVPTVIVEALDVVPTEPPIPTATLLPTSTPVPIATTVTAVPTAVPTIIPTEIAPSPTATVVVEDDVGYQVAFVTADDTLNVRAGAGVDFGVVGELLPSQTEVEIVGEGQLVASSTWVPIRAGAVEGWVNGRYLTPMQSETTFCEDEAVMALAEGLRTAVLQRDGAALAQLVDPERGLRIRTNWWNPEVLLAHAELVDIFVSDTVYDFGIHDGSGEPFVGTFVTEIVPWLDKDLLPASEIGCNELLNGGSAGIVKLPDEYEPLNFVTFYRPHGPDQIELDWGSWAIGVEKLGDRYTISYLVHFQWEI